MIMYVRRRTYLVGYDKMLGRCIRNVSFYWHERYAIGEGAILGYPNARYMLCRLFVTEENSRFLTCCWIGYDETANATLLSSCLRKTGNFWPAIPIPNSAARR